MKPRSLRADQVIVAWLMTSSPDEPGVATVPLLETGPCQWTSKLEVPPTDTGDFEAEQGVGDVEIVLHRKVCRLHMRPTCSQLYRA